MLTAESRVRDGGVAASPSPSKDTESSVFPLQWAPAMELHTAHFSLSVRLRVCWSHTSLANAGQSHHLVAPRLNTVSKEKVMRTGDTYALWSEPTSLWEDSCLTVGVTMAG